MFLCFVSFFFFLILCLLCDFLSSWWCVCVFVFMFSSLIVRYFLKFLLDMRSFCRFLLNSFDFFFLYFISILGAIFVTCYCFGWFVLTGCPLFYLVKYLLEMLFYLFMPYLFNPWLAVIQVTSCCGMCTLFILSISDGS